QVDERFPYFLSNANSDFAIYSATDMELTYAWDKEWWDKADDEARPGYAKPAAAAMTDPVAALDDDDEICFMFSDAGTQAPADALGPAGTSDKRQEIALTDPLDPAGAKYVYLFLRPSGSSFTKDTGYVRYQRDANADQWIDRNSFAEGDPEQLGSSNTGYGPNLPGDVWVTADHLDANGYTVTKEEKRFSTDRFPRDGVRVSTDNYQWYASGRWMIREMHVALPGQDENRTPDTTKYGTDMIDRWKARAFQETPDSIVSTVTGFGLENEQTNWEANSCLLGERVGPVRAIREIWGSDSGTNVTKIDTFYRDAVTYRFHVRVHPMPPDGIYTNWDYNHDAVTKYYNAVKTDGVLIDGNPDDVGQINDQNGMAIMDLPDPTFDIPYGMWRWEQVSGEGNEVARDNIKKGLNGSLVYSWEVKGITSLATIWMLPFYSDDMNLDDGTGDDPVPRPWPGEPLSDPKLADYAAGVSYPNSYVKQGAFGSHGLHVFFSSDTDNAFVSPVPTTEVDIQQWQFAVPTDFVKGGHAIGEPYAQNVRFPVIALGTEQANTAAAPPVNNAPVANAGPDQAVKTGTLVQLDGSASSDPDGDAITYKWTIVSQPGSATLTGDTTAAPSFTPDKDGTYTLQLVVSDGETASAPDTVIITATPDGLPAAPGLSNSIITADDGSIYVPKTYGTYGKSYLAYYAAAELDKEGMSGRNPKKFLYLEGTPYERGYAEGYLCPKGVYRMTHDFIYNFLSGMVPGVSDVAGSVDLSLVLPSAVKLISQLALAQEHNVPQEFRDEMRGIADGAQDRGYDVRYEDVLTLNVAYDLVLSLEYQGGSLMCNEMAVFGDATTNHHLFHGRDFMFSTGGDVFSDEAILIVHNPKGDVDKYYRGRKPYLLVGSAAPAFVGFPTALNEMGVSFGMDMVPNRQNRALITGMGTLLMCRDTVTHASDLQAAIANVKNTSRGVSWLFAIADGKVSVDDYSDNAVVLETVTNRMITTGDDYFATLTNILPGLSSITAGAEMLIPDGASLRNGAGEIITGVSDLALEGSALVPVVGDAHPDRGVAVRTADYVDPAGLDQYSIVLPMADPQISGREQHDDVNGGETPQETTFRLFPLQTEKHPDVVAATNHYILPQMNMTQMGLFYHTVDTQMGGGRESEWRYGTLVQLIERYYGNIDRETAMWLIDFLNPARAGFYGKGDITQSVKGHHVLIDNNTLEIWSLHGYYNEPWIYLDLKKFIN
ncbi:MAG: PKD domain-containing protein, partial [Smithellaceae bacterium]|nr:PKD domain-containing protein [Smithellaceae bacterium]